MPTIAVTNIGGVNTYVNPLTNEGQLLHSVNVDSQPYGAKSKRPGYITYLGTADGSAVNSLFTWYKNDGTTFFNYRASGSSLYYSVQGTGAWTLAGNGTISAGSKVRSAVLDNTLLICDGVGSTRHTTNGTAFTNTTLAPIAVDLCEYQNRIYAAGTSSTLFYSTTNDATNWSTSGTSDSSSLQIPGAGKLSKIFKVADMLCANKNSGVSFRWDGYSLVDNSTTMAPTAPDSVVDAEGFKMFLNRLGVVGYGGGKFQLISNPVQRQIYNNAGSGIPGGQFDIAPGGILKYGYYLGVGTVTDDFIGRTINNAVLKYDYQKNEFLDYSFAHNPTSFNKFKDANGIEQLIFGSSSGQCYQISGTAKSDAGSAISSEMIYCTTLEKFNLEKDFHWFYGAFNPGCEAQIQIAIGNTYTLDRLRWIDIGDVNDGVAYYRFPQGSRGRLLFIKISESSTDSPFAFYGFSVSADYIER